MLLLRGTRLPAWGETAVQRTRTLVRSIPYPLAHATALSWPQACVQHSAWFSQGRMPVPLCDPAVQFFMAPSLTTGKGDVVATSSTLCRYRSQVLGGPVATLRLRYETPTTLLLRGVLKQSDPQHRAILQQFPGGCGCAGRYACQEAQQLPWLCMSRAGRAPVAACGSKQLAVAAGTMRSRGMLDLHSSAPAV